MTKEQRIAWLEQEEAMLIRDFNEMPQGSLNGEDGDDLLRKIAAIQKDLQAYKNTRNGSGSQ
jgi:hypothetical protein